MSGVIIKFLPIPFAVLLATVVLRIKPIEAEFAHLECRTNVDETCGVLYTLHGAPVDPTKMASQLANTYSQFGFPISIAPLRHALEAFSHKFAQRCSGWSDVFAEQANHNIGTSARYGRDDGSFVGIPSDVSEANFVTCNDWNTVILGSPSIFSRDSEAQLLQQLKELNLLDTDSQADKLLSQQTQVFKRPRIESEQNQHTESNVAALDKSPVSRLSQSAGMREIQSQPALCLHESQHMTALDTSPVSTSSLSGVLREVQTQALRCLHELAYSAIIVMPTGSGKTQLIWSHRKNDKCSIIFAPYRLLCSQLRSISQNKGVTVEWPLASFNGSTDALILTAEFAIFPYEAAPHAHSFIAALHEKGRLGPIWIDEVGKT
jgi:hypothetical protein